MSDNHDGGGCNLFTLLAVLFVGLKLGGVISWSWWWVLSPLWLPIAFLALICAIAISIHCIQRI